MATVATRREKKKLVEPSQRRIDLTPTGLLMEGHCTQNTLRVRFGALCTASPFGCSLATSIPRPEHSGSPRKAPWMPQDALGRPGVAQRAASLLVRPIQRLPMRGTGHPARGSATGWSISGGVAVRGTLCASRGATPFLCNDLPSPCLRYVIERTRLSIPLGLGPRSCHRGDG